MAQQFSDTIELLLRTYVYIPPEGLDNKWQDYLFNEIDRRYKDSCLPKCGFIIRIRKISRIRDMMITSISGHVRCLVDFYAMALMPQTGTCIDARVDLLSHHGVLLSHPYINILIPAKQMKADGYELRPSFSSSMVFASPNHHVVHNSILTIMLTHVRFENHAFSALGKIHQPVPILV